MIKTVKITNYRGEVLTLDLANPYSSGLAVTNIDGLGPEKASINTVEIASNDGAMFNSARVESRNIVMSLRFVGTNVEECRRLTYKFFPLKKTLTFEVITDERQVAITGYVESNEPNIFSKTENTKISIICPDPYFKSSLNPNVTIVFYGEEPLFEFPFENEGNEPMLEVGRINDVTEANVPYEGDSEVGGIFTIHALGPAKNIRIDNLDTGETMIVNIELAEGDDLVISTVAGKKSVRRLRNGIYTNVLNLLDKSSNWFKIARGDNAFAYQAEEGLDNLRFDVSHTILYEGV